MCFFQDVFLSISCIFSLYWIYKEYVSKDRSRKNTSNYELFLLGSFLLLLLFPSLVRYFLLDLLIMLAYQEKLPRMGILLSLLFVFCFLMMNIIPSIWVLFLLVGYFLIMNILRENRQKSGEMVLLFKGFILSTLLFQRDISFPLGFLVLFFLLLIQSFCLSKMSLILIKVEDMDDGMNELEKNLFKITHEIKNPITVCKGYLDMLDPKDVKKTEKYLPILKNEIARTLVIMEDFMSIRNVSIKTDIMDFYLLIEDLHDTVELLLRKYGCSLEVPDCTEELFILADYDRLKQVFINLIKNSVEAGAKNILIETKVKNGRLTIVVYDTGKGIPEETLSHLGELFFTTKQTGTGVGVHLSEEIVRLHKGKMKYSSKVGKGTKVTITLPIQKEK